LNPPPTNASSPRAILCKDLVKSYRGGVQAVRGLDLEVYEGECFGLLGPNGAGKTTTIEILEGLLAPTSGEVQVLGRSWGSREKELRSRIGISLQETKLPEKITVREILRLFRSFYPRGLEPEEAIRLVGLEEKTNARTGKLSGGQRQRLAIACALAGDPDLLFLDEPTTGLDPHARRQLWDILNTFKSRGKTILLTTHYMDEAERLCDRVAIVDRGRVIALGSPPELIASLGGEHVIELTLEANGSGDAEGVPPVLTDEAVREIPGVRAIRVEGRKVSLTASEPHRAIPGILERLGGNGSVVSGLAMRHASLEDVFVKLAGRSMEEADADVLAR
jgi:ABC-2 type transport system ATP-binding protein